MPVTSDQTAPYAPGATVLAVIERHRARGLPSPINGEVLARAGVSDSLVPRTLQALQILDLITDRGEPTTVFESIRKAPEAEYKQRLKEWLDGAYADVLQFADPASDDETKIRDAFRNYKPIGQQGRMVTLFQTLYQAAGVAPEKSSQPRTAKPISSLPRLPRPIARVNKQIGLKPASVMQTSGLPPALSGLLASLPPAGKGWSQADRDKFISTFQAVLDFCFPVVEESDEEVGDVME